MNPLRFAAKNNLDHTQPILCPLCNLRPWSQMHEIVYSGNHAGSKYDPDPNDPFAQLLFHFYNCIGLCPECNVLAANSVPKEDMIALKLAQPRVVPERLIEHYRKMIVFVKYPSLLLPSQVIYRGETYTILETT